MAAGVARLERNEKTAAGGAAGGGVLDTTRARTIVVPIDGSWLSQKAVAVAEGLAGTLHAGLVFVEAVVPAYAPGLEPNLAYDATETNALTSLQEAKSAAEAKGLPAAVVLVKGELGTMPAEAILTCIHEFAADLVVMGTHGRTGAQRALLGSVADEVIRRAPMPVLLVPQRCATAPDGKPPDSTGTAARANTIVVALDGSPAAEAALAPAVSLASALGGAIELVQVLPEARREISGSAGAQPETANPAAYLETVTERLTRCGMHADDVWWAAPTAGDRTVAETLLDHAARVQATLLVVATHARHGIVRLLRGSVEAALVAQATLPILVVRSDEAKRAAR